MSRRNLKESHSQLLGAGKLDKIGTSAINFADLQPCFLNKDTQKETAKQDNFGDQMEEIYIKRETETDEEEKNDTQTSQGLVVPDVASASNNGIKDNFIRCSNGSVEWQIMFEAKLSHPTSSHEMSEYSDEEKSSTASTAEDTKEFLNLDGRIKVEKEQFNEDVVRGSNESCSGNGSMLTRPISSKVVVQSGGCQSLEPIVLHRTAVHKDSLLDHFANRNDTNLSNSSFEVLQRSKSYLQHYQMGRKAAVDGFLEGNIELRGKSSSYIFPEAALKDRTGKSRENPDFTIADSSHSTNDKPAHQIYPESSTPVPLQIFMNQNVLKARGVNRRKQKMPRRVRGKLYYKHKERAYAALARSVLDSNIHSTKIDVDQHKDPDRAELYGSMKSKTQQQEGEWERGTTTQSCDVTQSETSEIDREPPASTRCGNVRCNNQSDLWSNTMFSAQTRHNNIGSLLICTPPATAILTSACEDGTAIEPTSTSLLLANDAQRRLYMQQVLGKVHHSSTAGVEPSKCSPSNWQDFNSTLFKARWEKECLKKLFLDSLETGTKKDPSLVDDHPLLQSKRRASSGDDETRPSICTLERPREVESSMINAETNLLDLRMLKLPPEIAQERLLLSCGETVGPINSASQQNEGADKDQNVTGIDPYTIPVNQRGSGIFRPRSQSKDNTPIVRQRKSTNPALDTQSFSHLQLLQRFVKQAEQQTGSSGMEALQPGQTEKVAETTEKDKPSWTILEENKILCPKRLTKSVENTMSLADQKKQHWSVKKLVAFNAIENLGTDNLVHIPVLNASYNAGRKETAKGRLAAPPLMAIPVIPALHNQTSATDEVTREEKHTPVSHSSSTTTTTTVNTGIPNETGTCKVTEQSESSAMPISSILTQPSTSVPLIRYPCYTVPLFTPAPFATFLPMQGQSQVLPQATTGSGSVHSQQPQITSTVPTIPLMFQTYQPPVLMSGRPMMPTVGLAKSSTSPMQPMVLASKYPAIASLLQAGVTQSSPLTGRFNTDPSSDKPETTRRKETGRFKHSQNTTLKLPKQEVESSNIQREHSLTEAPDSKANGMSSMSSVACSPGQLGTSHIAFVPAPVVKPDGQQAHTMSSTEVPFLFFLPQSFSATTAESTSQVYYTTAALATYTTPTFTSTTSAATLSTTTLTTASTTKKPYFDNVAKCVRLTEPWQCTYGDEPSQTKSESPKPTSKPSEGIKRKRGVSEKCGAKKAKKNKAENTLVVGESAPELKNKDPDLPVGSLERSSTAEEDTWTKDKVSCHSQYKFDAAASASSFSQQQKAVALSPKKDDETQISNKSEKGADHASISKTEQPNMQSSEREHPQPLQDNTPDKVEMRPKSPITKKKLQMKLRYGIAKSLESVPLTFPNEVQMQSMSAKNLEMKFRHGVATEHETGQSIPGSNIGGKQTTMFNVIQSKQPEPTEASVTNANAAGDKETCRKHSKDLHIKIQNHTYPSKCLQKKILDTAEVLSQESHPIETVAGKRRRVASLRYEYLMDLDGSDASDVGDITPVTSDEEWTPKKHDETETPVSSDEEDDRRGRARRLTFRQGTFGVQVTSTFPRAIAGKQQHSASNPDFDKFAITSSHVGSADKTVKPQQENEISQSVGRNVNDGGQTHELKQADNQHQQDDTEIVADKASTGHAHRERKEMTQSSKQVEGSNTQEENVVRAQNSASPPKHSIATEGGAATHDYKAAEPDSAKPPWKKAVGKQRKRRRRGQYSAEELTCQTCRKVFVNVYRLRRHEASHVDLRPFTCDICGKAFKQAGHRNEHRLIHCTKRRSFLCSVCGVVIASRSSFRYHLQHHHQQLQAGIISTSQYLINRCDEEDVQQQVAEAKEGENVKDGGKVVVRKHNDRRRKLVDQAAELAARFQADGTESTLAAYDCPHCTERFGTAQSLNCHLETHIEIDGRCHVQPYTCRECGRSFTYRHNLEKHVEGHRKVTAEKRAESYKKKVQQAVAEGRPHYVCDNCGKIFLRKETLVKHKRIHLGMRPHQCPHCQKRFTQKIHLTVHSRLHTGSRPFQCRSCRCCFLDSTALARHVERGVCMKDGFNFNVGKRGRKPSFFRGLDTCDKKTSTIKNKPVKSLSCNQCRWRGSKNEFLIKHLARCHPKTQSKHSDANHAASSNSAIDTADMTMSLADTDNNEPKKTDATNLL